MQAEKLLARAKRRKVEVRLQFGLDKVYGGSLAAYRQAARQAGCAEDQIERFIRYGYVAQPKQLEFHAAARSADHPDGPEWIGIGGARAGAKSHAALAQVGLDDCQRFPGLKILFLRKVGKAARESIKDLRDHVLHSIPNVYKEAAGMIVFENGSRIIVGHFQNEGDVDQYLGLEYDGIVPEEATTLTWEKFQKVIGSMRSSKPGWRPRAYPTTNPGGVGHAWFKKTFIEPMRKKAETITRFIQATVYDNAFVNPEYRRYLESLTGWLRRAWLHGDWDIAAGQFFTTFRQELHAIEPFRIPADWRVWASMDYGFVHPQTMYLHAQDGDGTVYTIGEHKARRWQVQQHVTAFEEMLARHHVTKDRLETIVAGSDVFAKRDPAAPTIAAQYEALGLTLSPANTDRVNGAARMLGLLGDVEQHIPPRWYIFKNCVNLVEKLPVLEHDPHRPEDVLKVDADEDGNGGDDEYDGARYGLMEVSIAAQAGWGADPLAGYRG